MLEILLPVGVMGGLGLVLSTALLVAAKKFYVYEDPRIGQVELMLPGANCGGCGKTGCKAFAEALVKADEEGLSCPVCSQEMMGAIAEFLGQALSAGPPQVAHVMCEGLKSSASFNGLYDGIHDCRGAHLVGQVDRACSYGCVGLGTCVEACAFDALEVYDGIAHVIPENCVACGKCIEACPRELIVLIPKGRQVFVPCKSRDAGKVVNKVCEIGCIACQKCVKVCPSGAIIYGDNLAAVDSDKCTLCYECVVACPRDLIKVRDLGNYVVGQGDLKHGLDLVADQFIARKAQEQAERAAAEQAAGAAPGMDPEAARQLAKLHKALEDARAKAAADSEFAARLPAMEAKLQARIDELTSTVKEAQA